MRPRRGLVAALTVAGLALIASSTAAPAGATGVDVCDLLTKKEATQILDAKVVETKRVAEPNGAQRCDYRTNHLASKRYKRVVDSPLTLRVTWQELTPALRAQLAEKQRDLEPIAGLGDEAYLDGTGVIAIRGSDVLNVDVDNWDGEAPRYLAMAKAAASEAVGRLPTG